MILINGQPENRINALDRGLHYGDGLFETIAFRDGRAEFLPAHLQRLYTGCGRLNIPLDSQILEAELTQLIASLDSDQVLKIIITRGVGGRGYRISPDMQATRIISTHPLSQYPASHAAQGIELHVCQQRLAYNPTLAGIKHLNRLEQVLARAEWQTERFAEGLMLDYEDQVVEGTMSNVFISRAGQLLTPVLEHAGIAGIMRGEIIDIAAAAGIDCRITAVSKQDVLAADEMFICNSLIGIWPVNTIPAWNKHFVEFKLSSTLQQELVRMRSQ